MEPVMTHMSPRLADQAPRLPLTLSLRAAPIGLDPGHIPSAAAAKRAEIASLEADWAADSERAAARSLGGIGRLGERETWDRATWNRYLAAAQESQHLYLPRLRRLYAEVERLEQLQNNPLRAGRRRVA
jgi:hypothetical protein